MYRHLTWATVSRAHRKRFGARAALRHREVLRCHAGLVVSRLHTAETGLYSTPDTTLPELAELLLTVADRHVSGRTSALLDDLDGVSEPAYARLVLWLRASLAVFVVLGTVIAVVGPLDLPGGTDALALAGAFGLASVILNGPRGLGLPSRSGD